MGKTTGDNLGLKRSGLTGKEDLKETRKEAWPERKAKREIKEEIRPERKAKGEEKIER